MLVDMAVGVGGFFYCVWRLQIPTLWSTGHGTCSRCWHFAVSAFSVPRPCCSFDKFRLACCHWPVCLCHAAPRQYSTSHAPPRDVNVCRTATQPVSPHAFLPSRHATHVTSWHCRYAHFHPNKAFAYGGTSGPWPFAKPIRVRPTWFGVGGSLHDSIDPEIMYKYVEAIRRPGSLQGFQLVCLPATPPPMVQ
jgi:hypothetical protein